MKSNNRNNREKDLEETCIHHDGPHQVIRAIYIDSRIIPAPIAWGSHDASYPVFSAAYDVDAKRVVADRIDRVESSHQLIGDLFASLDGLPKVLIVGSNCDFPNFRRQLEKLGMEVIPIASLSLQEGDGLFNMASERFFSFLKMLREEAADSPSIYQTIRIPL